MSIKNKHTLFSLRAANLHAQEDKAFLAPRPSGFGANESDEPRSRGCRKRDHRSVFTDPWLRGFPDRNHVNI